MATRTLQAENICDNQWCTLFRGTEADEGVCPPQSCFSSLIRWPLVGVRTLDYHQMHLPACVITGLDIWPTLARTKQRQQSRTHQLFTVFHSASYTQRLSDQRTPLLLVVAWSFLIVQSSLQLLFCFHLCGSNQFLMLLVSTVTAEGRAPCVLLVWKYAAAVSHQLVFVSVSVFACSEMFVLPWPCK